MVKALKNKIFCSALLAFVPMVALADNSIGDVAQNLMAPTEVVTKLMLVACYVIGVALILVGLAQYKIHLQSPKLVPLTTPIALLILGTVALLIPYVSDKFETGNAQKQNLTTEKGSVLPLPDVNRNRGALLPAPSGSDQSSGSQNSDQNRYPDNAPSPVAPVAPTGRKLDR